MDDNQFFKFVAELYNTQLAVPERIYTRIPLVVSGIVIIGGFAAFLTDLEYLSQGGNWLTWLYYVAGAFAILLLVASTFCVCKGLYARQYGRLKSASYWDGWRTSYASLVRDSSDEYTEAEVKSIVAAALRDTMAVQMMSLTEFNQAINERRFWWVNNAVGLAVWSLIPVGIEGACRFFLVLLEQSHA